MKFMIAWINFDNTFSEVSRKSHFKNANSVWCDVVLLLLITLFIIFSRFLLLVLGLYNQFKSGKTPWQTISLRRTIVRYLFPLKRAQKNHGSYFEMGILHSMVFPRPRVCTSILISGTRVLTGCEFW